VVHAKREAAHTTVVLPAQVAGLSRAEDPAWAQSLLDALKESPVEMGTPVLGFYGDGTTFLVVAAGAHYLSQGDQKDFMRGARSGLGGSGLGGMTFRDAPSGGHGRMTCAVAAGRGATMCLWADNGSYGVVVVGGGLQGVSHAVQARETVVRRP
jgi:hypothetical protein